MSTWIAVVRRRLLGLVFLVVVVLFVGVTVAIYGGVFSSNEDIVLRAGSLGNQLSPQSDVKIRGVVVGSVRKVSSTPDGAEVSLALDPAKTGPLPVNVSAQFLSTTLFGPRYVSLELPARPSPERLASGDTIEEDHSAANVEVQRVLADTLPVLQAVRPQDLASTLGALDQALSGRGATLGQTLSQLNTYINGLNPSIPNLRRDLHSLVGVATTYQQAAPEVLRALRNLSTTSQTLVQQQRNLTALTAQLTATSNDATGFLEANQRNLIQLNTFSRPTTNLLAEYSPQYPCFLQQMAQYVPRIRKAFGAGTNQPGLHITLQVTQGRGAYLPGQDAPAYKDTRGPECYPVFPPGTIGPQYPPNGPYQDGSTHPPAPSSNQPSSPQPTLPLPESTSSQWATGGLGVENSPPERDFVAALLAPTMNEPPQDVPQWGSLLVGPVLRGEEVSYR